MIISPSLPVYYEIVASPESNKPWLTLLHGFTQNRKIFDRQVSRFQAYFRLLLVDLRGHGGSARHDGPFGIEEYTQDLIAVLNAAGIEQTHYWGTHTGSAVGLKLAHQQPERVISLVLEGTVIPGLDVPEVSKHLNRAKSIARSSGVEAAMIDWFEHGDWYSVLRLHPRRCRAKEQRDILREFSGKPWLTDLTPHPVSSLVEYLPTIQQPTLVYNGEFDLPGFKNAAGVLESNLPHVTRKEIKGAGSFAGWEAPQLVNTLVFNFLDAI